MDLLGSSIIDLGALWKIVVVSILAGAGVVGAFGYVLLGVSRYQRVREGSGRGGYVLLVAVAGGFCLGTVVVGLIALTHK